MAKYTPGITVLRVIPIREQDWFRVSLKIGPLTIRDVRFRPVSGDIGWPSKPGGAPIVLVQKNCLVRVRRKIADYLARHEIRRALASEPAEVERFCLYCHKSVQQNEHAGGYYHRQCLTKYDRDLKQYAARLASRVGQTNADQWLRRKRAELKRSLEQA